MRSLPAALAAAVAVVVCGSSLASVSYLSASRDAATGQWRLVQGADVRAAARGSFSDSSAHASNFGVLNIVTNASYSDKDQMFAAGLVEGALTWQRIYQHNQNMATWLQASVGSGGLGPLNSFLLEQYRWAQEQVANNPSDALWRQVGLLLEQLSGLSSGYNSSSPADKQLPLLTFLQLNGVGDALDLVDALYPHARPAWGTMKPHEVAAKLALRGHCSGLIKVTGNFSDLFAAHSSWFTYSAMLRIYKHYTFNVQEPSTAAKTQSFSSYPGFLESLDDFYIMSSGLVMVQTTNGIFNTSLYHSISTSSLLAWQRVRVANAMANSGQDWYNVVKQYNSGTYNNQYMVVDLSLFQPGSRLPSGLLWVVEQIPGLVVGDDVTQVLQSGYWASYNVPYFDEIYQRSGYPAMQRLLASCPDCGVAGLDYQLAPRAEIFRRDQASVTDVASLQHMMRYNQYTTDPYSKGNPFNAICSRGDLASPPHAGGCYDTKVTSFSHAQQLQSFAVNGPTAQGLPAFEWGGALNATAHVGQPLVFDFQFESMQPQDPAVSALHG